MVRFSSLALGALCTLAVLAPSAMARQSARVTTVDQSSVLRDARDGVVSVPAPEGGVQRFRVEPTTVAAPALQRRYPENRVFRGEGIDDPRARVMLGTGLQGFHAQVLTPRGDWYVDQRDDGRYLAYEAGAREARGIDQMPPIRVPESLQPAAAVAPLAARSSGGELRTYRFALATTGEYSAQFGGTTAGVHAELIIAMARLNGIYEAEVGAHFELVANNDSLIYLNAATDPYTNTDGSAMLSQNQTTVDTKIGNANYDLGHVFSTGGGGIAYLGVLGVTGYKAGGVTGSANPTGDDFWVDYVAHEMGHQMGGDHTFQGKAGACFRNGTTSSAMEPGSGSTIMAYAGICGADDLQPHSDAYFHARSYEQIRAVMEAASGVGTATPTGNTPPSVTPEGAAFTVPPRTPLRLSATATDANGDPLTYAWEEYDAGVLRTLATEPKNGGALFRSFSPVSDGVRLAPKMSSVLSGWTNQATGSCASFTGAAFLACNVEFLPTGSRTMTFRVTARDDRTGGGGVATADTVVTVSGTTPFAITSQNSPGGITSGGTASITWNTAGTAASPYGVSTVDILASADGGATFPYTLKANTTNDGAEAVDVPAFTAGAQVRLMVRARGNIFYDVNNAPLTAAVDADGPTISITTPGAGATYTQGQAVVANYSCTDTSGVATCNGSVANGAPIDTATAGTKTFTVSASDTLGNISTAIRTYSVVAPPPPDTAGPTISITTPGAGATYTQGQAVVASYACTDTSGVAACNGSVANGAPIDTATAGTKTFTVSGSDTLGNTSTASRTYTVAAPKPFTPSEPVETSAPAPSPSPLLAAVPSVTRFAVDAWAARGATSVGRAVAGGTQQLTNAVRRARTGAFVVHVINTGTGTDDLRVSGRGATRGWRVTYISEQGRDITAAITRGQWSTGPRSPGTGTSVTVRVSPGAKARPGATLALPVSVRSTGDPSTTDAIVLRTIARR